MPARPSPLFAPLPPSSMHPKGFAEAYMHGELTVDDLTTLLKVRDDSYNHAGVLHVSPRTH